MAQGDSKGDMLAHRQAAIIQSLQDHETFTFDAWAFFIRPRKTYDEIIAIDESFSGSD